MNQETLTALKASIQKWEDNLQAVVDNKTENFKYGIEECPLCQLYNNESTSQEDKCVGCPIYQETHIKFCGDSPYHYAEFYALHLFNVSKENQECTKSLKNAAIRYVKEEINFLKSLLHIEEK